MAQFFHNAPVVDGKVFFRLDPAFRYIVVFAANILNMDHLPAGVCQLQGLFVVRIHFQDPGKML